MTVARQLPVAMRTMRRRPSARLLLVDEEGRVLLFRVVFKEGVLAGQDYWMTPGGSLEEGETFPDAARRELAEETGFVMDGVGQPIAEKEFVLKMTTGEEVLAHEQFFLVRVSNRPISTEQWTELEKKVMVEHRWWSMAELMVTKDRYFPEDLMDLLHGR